MALPDIPPEISKLAPGLFGALGSLIWIKETWPRRLAMFIVGAGLARYGATNAAHWTGLDEGFAGFMLGLLGMSIVAKFVEVWTVLDLGLILRDWLRKVLGLPAKDV